MVFIWRFPISHRGTLKIIHLIFGFFNIKPSSYWGTPNVWNPPYSQPNWVVSRQKWFVAQMGATHGIPFCWKTQMGVQPANVRVLQKYVILMCPKKWNSKCIILFHDLFQYGKKGVMSWGPKHWPFHGRGANLVQPLQLASLSVCPKQLSNPCCSLVMSSWRFPGNCGGSNNIKPDFPTCKNLIGGFSPAFSHGWKPPKMPGFSMAESADV